MIVVFFNSSLIHTVAGKVEEVVGHLFRVIYLCLSGGKAWTGSSAAPFLTDCVGRVL